MASTQQLTALANGDSASSVDLSGVTSPETTASSPSMKVKKTSGSGKSVKAVSENGVDVMTPSKGRDTDVCDVESSEMKKRPAIFGIAYYATEKHFIFGELEINRAMLPLKLMMFCFYGAMAALLPYVTIHMQTLGISIEEIAVIYAVLPFTSFLGPPITGFIADKCGNYKTVLSLSIGTTAAFHTLLLFVPPYFRAAEVPVTFKFHCLTDYSYFSVPGAETNPNKQCGYPQLPVSLAVANCSYHCPEGRAAKICGPSGDCLPQGDLRAIFPSNSALPPLVPNASTTLTLSLMPGLSNGLFRRMDEIVLEGVKCICPMTCAVAETSTQKCPMVGNEAITFWTYFVLRIVATLFMGAAFSLLDATALSIVSREGKEYGKQRVWAIIAMAILSPITGIMVDVISNAKGYIDYSSAFYVSDLMSFLNIFLGFFLAFNVEPAKEDLLANMGKILRVVEADVFLFMMFILGGIWGFVESYLFIYLKELGAPSLLLGLTLTIGSVVGIPFLYGAESIVNKVGRANVIILAFFVYFARCFGYSYITSPWWCFPFEAMEAFTYHLMWVAAATYVTVLAPPGLLATMTGIMGAVHFSVGKGAGSFAGGYLIGATGMRNSFRYIGIFAAIVGVLYLAIQHLYLKRKIQDRMEKEAAVQEEKEKEAHFNEAIIVDDEGLSRVAFSSGIKEPLDDEKEMNAVLSYSPDSGSHTMLGSPEECSPTDDVGILRKSATATATATTSVDPTIDDSLVTKEENVVRKRDGSGSLDEMRRL